MNETAYLNIKGMHCINCPIKIEKAISKMDGVIEVDINWENEKGCVTFDQSQLTISDIINKINKMDFKAEEINQKV